MTCFLEMRRVARLRARPGQAHELEPRLHAAAEAPRPVPIHLITAESPESSRLRYSRLIQFPQPTLPLLAALTPAEHEIFHTDEIVESVRFDLPAELVGITAPTPSALHAYALADEFRGHGMAVHLGVMFGFDEDDPGISERTVDFLERAHVDVATVSVVGPKSGPPTFLRLRAEGGILTEDWSQYDGKKQWVFPPGRMSPEEPVAGADREKNRERPELFTAVARAGTMTHPR